MLSSGANLLAEALFVSDLQPSQAPSVEVVRATTTQMILRYGSDGCAACTAAEFGDHPDNAVRRMAWVLRMLRTAYPLLVGGNARQLQLAR